MNNGNKKRIFISADIEGTAGAFLWEAGRKGTEEYNRQCRIMTEEVLSVVESLNEKYKGSIIFFVGLTLPRYRFSKPSASLDMNLR